MNIAAQTLHLLRFDLLRMRWVIVVCYAMLALSVIVSMAQVQQLTIPREILPYLCTGVFALAAVFAVQGDSPLRPDAFWRGQATRPVALLLEKTLLIGVLFVLLPLVVALVAVSSYNLTPAEMASQMVPAARLLAMWVAVCTLVAVSTTDLKSAILLFLGSLICLSALLTFGGRFAAQLMRALPSLTLVPIFMAVGIVIAVTYLRRLPSRVTMALAVLLAGVGVASVGVAGVSSRLSRVSSSRDASYAYPATLVAQPESLQVDGASLPSALQIDGVPAVNVSLVSEKPGARYSLSWARLTAYFLTGDSVTVSLRGLMKSPAVDRLVSLPDGVRLRSSSARDLHHRGTLSVSQTTSEYVRFSGSTGQSSSPTSDRVEAMPGILRRLGTDSVTHVRVDVMLNRFRQVEMASLPLNGPTAHNEHGRRLAYRRRTDAASDAFTVGWSTMGETRAEADRSLGMSDWRFTRPFLFVLQNTARGDAVVMHQGNVVNRGETFVLPGIERHAQRFALDSLDMVDGLTLDEEWLKNATLRVVRWELEGRVALSADHVVPRR